MDRIHLFDVHCSSFFAAASRSHLLNISTSVIRALTSALSPVPFSDFPIFSRGIVPPYWTTTGQTSDFADSAFCHLPSDLCHLSSVLCHLTSVIGVHNRIDNVNGCQRSGDIMYPDDVGAV